MLDPQSSQTLKDLVQSTKAHTRWQLAKCLEDRAFR